MNIGDFITELYCKIDDARPDLPQHPQALLSRSAVVTIGIHHAIKNVSRRAFYCWLKDNYGHRFPERARRFRRLEAQACWTGGFLAQPTLLGVADRYGIALGHPVRSGRNLHQVGRKGPSNHRWIVGGKLGIVLNKLGLVADWDCATANVPDQRFRPLLASCADRMMVLADTGFHRAKGDPANVKIGRRGPWNVRMMVETTFAMLTAVWGAKQLRHITWLGFEAHLSYLMAAFNILVQWNGMPPDGNGRIHRSIAQFTI